MPYRWKMAVIMFAIYDEAALDILINLERFL